METQNRPGMFEGVGAIGLNWLEKVKETGLMIATSCKFSS